MASAESTAGSPFALVPPGFFAANETLNELPAEFVEQVWLFIFPECGTEVGRSAHLRRTQSHGARNAVHSRGPLQKASSG